MISDNFGKVSPIRFMPTYNVCRRCGNTQIYDHNLCYAHHISMHWIPPDATYEIYGGSIRAIFTRMSPATVKKVLNHIPKEALEEFSKKALAALKANDPFYEFTDSTSAGVKWDKPVGFAKTGMMDGTAMLHIEGKRMLYEETKKVDSLASILFGR